MLLANYHAERVRQAYVEGFKAGARTPDYDHSRMRPVFWLSSARKHALAGRREEAAYCLARARDEQKAGKWEWPSDGDRIAYAVEKVCGYWWKPSYMKLWL